MVDNFINPITGEAPKTLVLNKSDNSDNEYNNIFVIEIKDKKYFIDRKEVLTIFGQLSAQLLNFEDLSGE